MQVNQVIEGDCLEAMKGLPDNCIDTIITDPPYELNFMGKKWDANGIAFNPAVWLECLRVAKPGATLMAFGGTRTYHRLVCAIEDAGWEIRDCIMYIYGSGFPKSHDISKGIDRAKGAERKNGLPLVMPAGNKGQTVALGGGWQETPCVTLPATPLAQQWDGWGTAIKPAYEPIVLAMKPVEKGYAYNAEKWGVAGLWIDGARIETGDNLARNRNGINGLFNGLNKQDLQDSNTTKGRFPANVIHDGSPQVEAEFAKAGVSVSRANIKSDNRQNNGKSIFIDGIHCPRNSHNDTGTASRFFYTAKASPAERGSYNNHPTLKPLSLVKYLCRLTKTPTGGVVLDPFAGSGTTGLACIAEDRDYILIEKEPEYVEIIKRRIAEYTGLAVPEPKEIEIAEDEKVKQLPLW